MIEVPIQLNKYLKYKDDDSVAFDNQFWRQTSQTPNKKKITISYLEAYQALQLKGKYIPKVELIHVTKPEIHHMANINNIPQGIYHKYTQKELKEHICGNKPKTLTFKNYKGLK